MTRRKLIFIDCGGHCGESIVEAKRRFGRNVCVVSFEPVPSLARRLEGRWRRYATVSIINAAVYDSEGLMPLFLSRAFTDGSSLMSDKGTGQLAFSEPIAVRVVRLADWLSGHFVDATIYLKLDIEGAEFAVLQDLLATGAIARVRRLFVEWHDHKMDNRDYLAIRRRIERRLHESGVRVEAWQPPRKGGERVLARPARLAELEGDFACE